MLQLTSLSIRCGLLATHGLQIIVPLNVLDLAFERLGSTIIRIWEVGERGVYVVVVVILWRYV